LWNYYDGLHHQLVAPNINLHYSEADMITVMKSGYVNEIEIKISKADFKNDFKHKKRKHWMMEKVRDTQAFEKFSANYFWYAIPKALHPKIDFPIPDYYGLIVIDEPLKFISIIKRAKLLHKGKITQKQLHRIGRSLTYKYWNQITKSDRS
jgi:hypothetical protein